MNSIQYAVLEDMAGYAKAATCDQLISFIRSNKHCSSIRQYTANRELVRYEFLVSNGFLEADRRFTDILNSSTGPAVIDNTLCWLARHYPNVSYVDLLDMWEGVEAVEV